MNNLKKILLGLILVSQMALAQWADQPACGSCGLGALADVLVVGPASNDVLIWNGSDWQNIRYRLNLLADTNILNAASNQVLVYDGSKWRNGPSTGAIAPGASGQVQISDGSNWRAKFPYLSDIFDSLFTQKASGQVLTYDGNNWRNYTIASSSPIVAGASGTVQISDGSSWRSKLPFLSDIYDTLFTQKASGQVLTYDGSNWRNLTIASSSPIVTGASGQVQISDGSSWRSKFPAITDLIDTLFTSPASSQSLVYDGTKWRNGTGASNGATKFVYLTDVAASTASSGQVAVYNGASWQNYTLPTGTSAYAPTIVSKATNYTLVASDIDGTKYFVNDGATQGIILSLPNVSAGKHVEIAVIASQTIQIQTAASNQAILYNGGNATGVTFIAAGSAGAGINLTGINNTKWLGNIFGNWSIGNIMPMPSYVYSYWRFDDVTGNLINLTSNGSAFNFAQNGTVPSGVGKIGNTRGPFTSSTNYFSHASNTVYNDNKALIIEGWFKVSTGGATQHMFSSCTDGHYGTSGFDLMMNTSNQIDFITGSDHQTYTGATYNDGNWHYILVGTFNTGSNNKRIYIDGALKSQQSQTNWTSNTDGAGIGAAADGANAFLGVLDELAFWSTVPATWAEVEAIGTARYNAGVGTTYVP